MRLTALLALLMSLAALQAQTPGQIHGLPSGALVVERQAIKSRVRADRALLLWMIKPSRNPRDPSDETYTCPDDTRGHYYSGPTRVSLLNTKTGRIINTINVRREYLDGRDSLDIPYRIHDGYYHVPGARGTEEGTPVIMWLKDYNGDGRAQEFALFNAPACMGLDTTLIGYSESQDKVIQYPISVTLREGRKLTRTTLYWADYLFSKTPKRPGYWSYEIDYRGRGGSLDRFEIQYNRRAERFEGRITYTPGE